MNSSQDYRVLHDYQRPQEEDFAAFFLLLLPLVLVGLFLWWRRGARDAQDVLRSGPPGQAERELPSS